MSTLNEIYKAGKGYQSYIDSAEDEARQKHLHYLKKMELTHEETKSFSSIKDEKRLLVFCSISCNDCRITLALLEGIRRANPLIQYSIASREENEELMQRLSGDKRIPLLVEIQDKSSKVIFNEFPDVLRTKMAGAHSEEQEMLREDFREGLYKAEMLAQLLLHLTI